MAFTRKDEDRVLSAEERDLVAQTHHPEVAALPDDELANLRKLVRERRDRAIAIARHQRREMRGKVDAKGAARVTGDAGSRLKASVLAQAVKRLNNEAARRQRKAARVRLVANMRRALDMKRRAAEPSHPQSRTAHQGMKSKPSRKAEQIADPREIGRVSQFVKDAQARRDR